LFHRKLGAKPKWTTEYEDTVYKIYDWNKNLAGYFFPKYDAKGRIDDQEELNDDNNSDADFDDENTIETLNKSHQVIRGGTLMVPLIKLNLLDKQEGISLNNAINSLQQNLQHMKRWGDWLGRNQVQFKIIGSAVYTAREDRNMLSIVLGVGSDITLGEKEVCFGLTPLLDRLHEDGML
jgi:hypothetical protein